MALEPQIALYLMNRKMANAIDRLDDGKENRTAPIQYIDIPEPFKAFNVEFHLDHPYWTVIKCDMDGPRFSNEMPDVNDYIRDYRRSIEEIEKLVFALKTVSFPGVPELSAGKGVSGVQAANATIAPPVDAIEEIRKHKALMEEGIITQQEFDAKKKQLLSI